jgi:hypothetical protein
MVLFITTTMRTLNPTKCSECFAYFCVQYIVLCIFVKPLLLYVQVNVIVEDENDNAPVFERSSYEGHVEENSPGGTEVTLDHLIHATDADVGHHAQFTFTLHGDGSELFTVDQASGRVFVKGLLLDREEKALYLLRIVARDKGKTGIHTRISRLASWLWSKYN